MPPRKNGKPSRPAKKKADSPGLKAIYADFRKRFSAADLQKYTEIEEGIPLEVAIEEMEKIHRESADSARGKRG
jgi:hypothetical protein